MKTFPLTKLPLNREGIIENIDENGDISSKLEELGFLAGNTLSVKHVAPLGDPLIVLLNGTLWALRKDVCEKISVRLN